MNRMIMRYPLMDEVPATGGEGGGGSTAPATGNATDTTSAPEEKTILDDGGEAQKEETRKAADNLLDDDNPADANDHNPAEKNSDEPTSEQIDVFKNSIKAIDLGDGVKWDDELLSNITPEIMKLCGGDHKRAEGLVKAYTKHQQEAARKFAEEQDAFNKGLIAQCRDRFGDDLKKVASYAKRGGLAFFGETIWNEMKKVPSFANNPDILERLADYGRRIATDDGKVTPKDGVASVDGDVLHRMYGNVKP